MMEASSPLAAMQQPSMIWNKDPAERFAPMANFNSPGNFAFNNMHTASAMQQEYFSMKPILGSSPTTSLAADLSQNFHIQQSRSPVNPTPRRSLFGKTAGGMFGHREATTPPIASSPCEYYEAMDISPLPHKAPFSMQIEVHSPCPRDTSESETQITSSPPKQDETPKLPEKKKANLLRPVASRYKAYSSNSIPQQLPPFRFGAGSSKLSTMSSQSTLSLGECFTGSPPQHEKRASSLDNPALRMMAPPKFKQSLSISVINNGSPLAQQREQREQRRSNNPLLRPRKQIRRHCSMFESTGDPMNGQKQHSPTSTSNALHSVMDIEELHQPVLPHFYPEGNPDSIPRITRGTLIEVLDGKYDSSYDKKKVVDCRFEYEYNGGHIEGALNYNDKDLLADELFEASASPEKTLMVFHCEYSAHRAPLMARHVRQQDRAANAEHYPRLHYPEVYILEGGYSGFYTGFKNRCEPQNYVEMDDKNHAYTCEREMGKLKKGIKGQGRGKLSRAQTFAFGEHGVEDSPTGPSRTGRGMDSMMLLDSSPLTATDRGSARRMASY